MKKIKLVVLTFILAFSFSIQSNSKTVPASFADLAEKLMPSVVNISTTQTVTTTSNPFPFTFPPGSPFEDMFREFGTPQERKSSALGSGFIIDEKGIVVTNNHVIQDAEDIIVRVNGVEEYKAKVIGADPLSDIAVLQLETKDKFTPVRFGDSDKARIGDWVIAIGNPFGLGGTVTSGIISARNRSIGLSRYEDYIQTDASINSGNSGGPLFDMNGDVIGINTAILGRSGSVGIGFSIPSNSAKIVIDQLIEFGETKRGWLGVRIQNVTKEIAEIDEYRNRLSNTELSSTLFYSYTNQMKELEEKLNNVLGYLTAMTFDKPELADALEHPLNELSEGTDLVNNFVLDDVIKCPSCGGSYVVTDLDYRYLCKDCKTKWRVCL